MVTSLTLFFLMNSRINNVYRRRLIYDNTGKYTVPVSWIFIRSTQGFSNDGPLIQSFLALGQIQNMQDTWKRNGA